MSLIVRGTAGGIFDITANDDGTINVGSSSASAYAGVLADYLGTPAAWEIVYDQAAFTLASYPSACREGLPTRAELRSPTGYQFFIGLIGGVFITDLLRAAEV